VVNWRMTRDVERIHRLWNDFNHPLEAGGMLYGSLASLRMERYWSEVGVKSEMPARYKAAIFAAPNRMPIPAHDYIFN
jgi:hypothetical protein